MKFFIDTADVDEIRAWNETGLIDGVTTNPSLILKSGRDINEALAEICDIVDGPVSGEVTALDTAGMIEQGKLLAGIADNICIKLPLTLDGLKACKALTDEGHKTNVTLCFSANQALLAAKAGATYVSPFVGRLDDISQNGMDLIGDIMTILRNYGFTTEVIVASIRNPMHVVESALMGADIATIPYKVITQLAKHPLTDIGMEKFLADWEKRQK